MRHQHPQQPQPDAAAAGGDAGPHWLGATAGGRGRRCQHGGRGRWHGHARGPPSPTVGQRYAQPCCGNQQHRGKQWGLLVHIALLQGERQQWRGHADDLFFFLNLLLIFIFPGLRNIVLILFIQSCHCFLTDINMWLFTLLIIGRS